MSEIIFLAILCAITIAFAILTIVFRGDNKSFNGMVCKFMASIGFILVAIVGFLYNPVEVKYFCFVISGLLFGLVGDVMLGIKEIAPKFKSKLVPLGTGFFLINHILFIMAFISLSGFSPVPLFFAFAGLAFAIGIMVGTKMKVNALLTILLPVYYTFLTYKMTSAAYLLKYHFSPAGIMVFLGTVLFLISDTCLGLLYFTPVKKKNLFVTVELSTYYPAQILLALSVALMVR